MATDKQSAEKEITVEEKLSTLYQLQTMMTEIDKIKTLRGELPLEVQDLEDEIQDWKHVSRTIKRRSRSLRLLLLSKSIRSRNLPH